ncbi:hypothetical protein [Cupriavidus sp. TMH.W2]|uniref:hypothetical protein n=1 Tax=Cupriavidus sp. TMH.W2 TaxID=3434465 RepID=UPI003D76BA6D
MPYARPATATTPGVTPAARFQVGHLTEIDPADPHYPNAAQASARAVQLSLGRPATGFGIWSAVDADTTLVAIAYGGALYWQHSQLEPFHD